MSFWKNVNYKENPDIEERLTALKLKRQTKKNITKLFEIFKIEKEFGRTNIPDICGMSYSSAGSLISTMRKENLIKEVAGYGKGKYRFLV